MTIDDIGTPPPELVEVVDDLSEYTNLLHLHGAADTDPDLEPSSWAQVDLTAALSGRIVRPQPTIGPLSDGTGLFYRAAVNGTHGDSGIGKSMVATWAAACELGLGRHVGWIDYESDELVIVERLRLFGASDQSIGDRFHYFRPQEGLDMVTRLSLVQRCSAWSMLVIDSVGEAFGVSGIDENKDVEVGPWLRHVIRPFADAGPAVVLIDHATKAADNPLHPSGSKRKRAAITGASYLVEAPVPPTRHKSGRLRLTCAKDRHGNYARGAAVCDLLLDVDPDGGPINWTARGAEPKPEWSGPQNCIAAIVDVLEGLPDTRLSTRQLGIALAERGQSYRSQTVRDAARLAAEAGQIMSEPGPRGANLYSAIAGQIQMGDEPF